MKKISKKLFFILVLALIGTITATALQANIGVVKNPTLDDIEYSYEGNISAEKAEQIIKAMFGIPDNTMQPFNLLCLLGHSKEKAVIKTTEHNCYPQNPKCRETYTTVEYCTRSGCSYYAVIDERSGRISCH